MSTITNAVLATMALDEMGVTSAGNPANAEDAVKVTEMIPRLFAELAARGVCDPAEDEIPEEWSAALSQLLASYCANAFGTPRKSQAEVWDAEDRLRVMVQRVDAPNRTLAVDSALHPRHRLYPYANWLRGT